MKSTGTFGTPNGASWANSLSSPLMPSILSFMKRGMSSPLPPFFRRSKSRSSTVTLSILIVVSSPPVAPLPGTTATTLFSTKPDEPCAEALP